MTESIRLSIPRKMLKKGSNFHALSLYLKVQEITKGSYDEPLFSVETLTYHLYHETSKKEEVKKLLKTLPLTKLATNCYSCSRNAFECDSFTTITPQELNTILYCGRNNAHALLQHFIRLIASLDSNMDNVGHMSVQWFATTYGISEHSVLNYNSALEELGLIYVHHQGVSLDGKCRTNLYGRAANKKSVISHSSNFTADGSANFMRSVSARYNAFIKNPSSFTDEQRDQLYEDCIKYNRKAKTPKVIEIIKEM